MWHVHVIEEHNYIVEPLNKGYVVLCRVVVRSSEVQNVLKIWEMKTFKTLKCVLVERLFYCVFFSEGLLLEVHCVNLYTLYSIALS